MSSTLEGMVVRCARLRQRVAELEGQLVTARVREAEAVRAAELCQELTALAMSMYRRERESRQAAEMEVAQLIDPDEPREGESQ